MSRNDRLLLGALIATFVILSLVAFAPSVASSSEIASRFWSLANSTFFVALITAFAGAFAGAYGAQFIANANARREALLREINAYNVAISTCFDIANVYLDFKRQTIRPVHDRYFHERKQVASIVRSGPSVHTPGLTIKCETRPIDRQFSPIESLRRSMEERMTSEGPALAFLTMLSRAISTLGTALDSREGFLRQLSQAGPHTQDELCERYFAIRNSDEIEEGTYPECMTIILQFTDDCIGFAILLARILRHYAKKLSVKLGNTGPKIAQVDWTFAEEHRLIPLMTRYEEMLERSYGELIKLRDDD